MSSVQVVQTNLFVAAALELRNANTPMLMQSISSDVCVEGVLEKPLCEEHVFSKYQATINTAFSMKEPILVRQENNLVFFVHHFCYLPQSVMLRFTNAASASSM